MTGEFAVGVHALVFLNHKKTVVSSEMVAENVCTNPARVRKILASLKRPALFRRRRDWTEGISSAPMPPR